MPQTTRGSIEEGAAQFSNEDYKDVTFDLNQAGRTHWGTPSIKLTSVDNKVYNIPATSDSSWSGTGIENSYTSVASSDSTVIPIKTKVLKFENNSNPYIATMTTTTRIAVPKYRVAFRLSEGSMIGENTVESGDIFEVQTSHAGSTWTTVNSAMYRSTNGGTSYSATATNGRITGGETSSSRFYHFYIDIDQSGQHEKANFLRFSADSTASVDQFLLYDVSFTAGTSNLGDLGLSNANIGVAFTNITSTGFRIVLSSKFTGYVRYLCSAYE